MSCRGFRPLIIITPRACVFLALHLLGLSPALIATQTTEWTEQELVTCLLEGGSLEAMAISSKDTLSVHVDQGSLVQTLSTLIGTQSGKENPPQDGYACLVKVKVAPGGQAKVTFPGLNRTVCGVVSPDTHSLVKTVAALNGCGGSSVGVSLDHAADNGTELSVLQLAMKWRNGTSSVVDDTKEKKAAPLLDVLVTGGSLDIRLVTSWQGYLQRHDVAGVPLGDTVPQKWVKLAVPPKHNVLISLTRRPQYADQPFSCALQDGIRVYVNGNNTAPRFLSCAEDASLPLLLDTTAVYVGYPSYTHARDIQHSWHVYIRLLFSFLGKRSGLRRSLPGGKWNCTLGEREWGEVRGHFPCNLRRDCEGGEDEESCPYTGPCGTGFISLPTGCYVFVGRQPGEKLKTWTESAGDCSDRGDTLASLNTPREWVAVTGLLRNSPHIAETFLGLSRTPRSLHSMYGKSLQWSDGTIAHWVVVVAAHRRSAPNSCTQVQSTTQHDHQPSAPFVFSKKNQGPGWPSPLPLTTLGQNSRRPYLCEMPPRVDINGTGAASERPPPGENSPAGHNGDASGAAPSPTPSVLSSSSSHDELVGAPSSSVHVSPALVRCPQGYLRPKTHACDHDCWGRRAPPPSSSFTSSTSPPPSLPPTLCLRHRPPKWECRCGGRWGDEEEEEEEGRGTGRLDYAALCDGRKDCADGSDEDVCVYPPCPYFACLTARTVCLPQHAVCDGRQDCQDMSDEAHCGGHVGGLNNASLSFSPSSPEQAVFVDLDVRGYLVPGPLPNRTCPDTHFRCRSNPDLCLPVFLVCNGIPDCPSGEDEGPECRDHYRCPNRYRCSGSDVCLHVSSVCDGQFQCPMGDDEHGCDVTCPDGCSCFDLVFFCSVRFRMGGLGVPSLRYLDASGSGVGLQEVSGADNMVMLHLLILAACGLRTLPDNASLPNLRRLDLSYNRLTQLDPRQLRGFPNLRELSLAVNPLAGFVLPPPTPPEDVRKPVDDTTTTFPTLRTLDLSGILLQTVDDDLFSRLGMVKLRELNLSMSDLHSLGHALWSLRSLRTLDVRHCPLQRFPHDVYRGLRSLRFVHASNFRLCCPALLPHGFNPHDCYAPFDEISSCEGLLRSRLNRFFLYLYALLAIVGNLGSLLYRFRHTRRRRGGGTSCNTLVTHLCVSDLFMGIYLLMIGVADYRYRGRYVTQEEEWVQSLECRAAGFLAFLSCEVSALIICLITLDRLLALRFPLSKLRFRPWTAHAACLVVWATGACLAGVPLLPSFEFWEFYSQTGVCIPLPITRRMFIGYTYSFAVLIAFNFLLFLVIAPGQALIYCSARRLQKAAGGTTESSENAALASRLFAIVMTDFLCWFPVCCLGLLSFMGFPVPGEFNVVLVIFVLPVNSALNPIIYTLGEHLDRQRRLQTSRCTCGGDGELGVVSETQAETNVDEEREEGGGGRTSQRSVGYIRSTLDMA